jgi:hypothetical protein
VYIYQLEHTKKLDLKTQNSRLASHFYFSMEFFKKYKGKVPPFFFFKKCGEISCFRFSSPRTSFLRSRRFDRHPSWKDCMHRKLHAQLHAHAISPCMRMRMQYSRYAIFSWWVSIKPSGPQECCPRRWEAKIKHFTLYFEEKDRRKFSLIFLEKFHWKIKVLGTLPVWLQKSRKNSGRLRTPTHMLYLVRNTF